MPQMSPMPWLTLLILTILSLFIISSYIYFINQKENSSKFKTKKKIFLIKW